MSVKIEKTNVTKIVGKGILRNLDDSGFYIEDPKTGDVELIDADIIKSLIGKEVALNIVNKEPEDE